MDKQALLATRSSPVYTQPSASYVNNFIIIYINLPFDGRLIAPARQSHREVASAPLAFMESKIQTSALADLVFPKPQRWSCGHLFVLRAPLVGPAYNFLDDVPPSGGGLRRQTVTPWMMIPHLTSIFNQGLQAFGADVFQYVYFFYIQYLSEPQKHWKINALRDPIVIKYLFKTSVLQ